MYNFKMKNKIGIFLTSLLLSLIFTTNVFAANINFSIDGIVVTSTTAVINGKIISSDFTQTLPHIYLYVGTTNETNIKTVSHIKGQLDQNTLNQPQNNALQFNELIQNLTPNTQYKYLISSAAGTNTSTLTNSITEKTGTFQTTASGSAITETTPPTTYTKPVINVFGSAVTLAGQAQNNYQPIEFRFKYGDNPASPDESTGFFPQHQATSTFFGITESFQKEITTYHGQPLVDSAMYYYVACAKNTFSESCDTAHVESFSPKKNQTVLTPNTSGTESGEWWFKPIKDGEAKGPFSSIAECEKERAKGNSYSKQCFQFYYPLAPLPGQADKIDTTTSGDSDCPFGNYLNILIKLFIGICAVLAMIKIVLGGMQYMTSELSSGKEDGKNSITSAVFGLILALGAFAILNTINPELLKVCLNNLPKATVVISPTDTSTGSDQSLCISTTNPPSINNVTGTTLNLNSSITSEYIPARDSLNLPIGIKLLITAQTAVEGFSATPTPGTKSYRTKNPGNIGNTDNGATKTFPTLVDGITAQKNIITNVANNSSVSYKLGSKPTCALGDEKYDGYLYQYLRIYSTGARMNNNYLSSIIGFFAANGKTITPKTTIAQIYALN